MDTSTDVVSRISELACSRCEKTYSAYELIYYSPCCTKPLVARYSQTTFLRSQLPGRVNSMWRYMEMLPLMDQSNMVSLGEGMTPMLDLSKSADRMGLADLKLKDEGQNPTGSFKARGLSMAVSKAKEFGITSCIIPSAGNAGGAMAAYCAAAGMEATVIMPKHTPEPYIRECNYYGAQVILEEGLIDKCGARASQIAEKKGSFNMATLKEPYRLEGKKTLGYEIAEQYNWELPDVILYPTGGGTGLIGIWKAFEEMIGLGWIEPRLPKMVVVQSENCPSVVDVINKITPDSVSYSSSIACGLAVPSVFGIDMIENVVANSNGLAVAVPESKIIESFKTIGHKVGVSISPEGAALFPALESLIERGLVKHEDRVLLLNTANALKAE